MQLSTNCVSFWNQFFDATSFPSLQDLPSSCFAEGIAENKTARQGQYILNLIIALLFIISILLNHLAGCNIRMFVYLPVQSQQRTCIAGEETKLVVCLDCLISVLPRISNVLVVVSIPKVSKQNIICFFPSRSHRL